MKLTPAKFRKWMDKYNLTIVNAAKGLGLSTRTIDRLLAGDWVLYGNKLECEIMLFRMKKYEESLK